MYRQFLGETSDRRCEAKEVGEGKGRKRGVMEKGEGGEGGKRVEVRRGGRVMEKKE